MKKKLRKSLWGLQWIFLKRERTTVKGLHQRTLDFSSIKDSVASDIEDFPEISMKMMEDYEMPHIKISYASTQEKYKMSHIEDLPNLSYKNPHISLESGIHSREMTERIKLESNIESQKQARPKTVGIRRVALPQKIIRNKKPEKANSTNRRKNYGKWFIPPEKWKKSLDHFLQNK